MPFRKKIAKLIAHFNLLYKYLLQKPNLVTNKRTVGYPSHLT
jgi:hypothetical protein